MKVLRRVLLLIILLIIIVVVIGYFLPRNVRIERSIVIPAQKELVFQQVNDFHKWKLWSPWLCVDSAIHISVNGPESGAGATLNYLSSNNQIGSGKLVITSSIPNDSILLDMNFMEDGMATGRFIFQQSDSGTYVKWIVESDLGNNPISRWFGLFMDPMAGKDFEQGLANLAELAGRIPATPIIAVLEKEMPSRYVLTIRDTSSLINISHKLSDYFAKISGIIKKKNLKVTGAPFAVFYHYSPELFDIEAGMPVDRMIKVNGNIKSSEIPSTKVVMASCFGHYESTAIVYNAIQKYIKEKSLIVTGSPWEEYITDPEQEPDTSKWQTDICFPVK